jgi:hypothetical protein
VKSARTDAGDYFLFIKDVKTDGHGIMYKVTLVETSGAVLWKYTSHFLRFEIYLCCTWMRKKVEKMLA